MPGGCTPSPPGLSTDSRQSDGLLAIALSVSSAVGQVTAWAQPLWGQPKTAAAQTPAPGGVTANLAAWYKADGTVGATQWNDESGNGKHMLAAGDGTAARMPTVEAAPAPSTISTHGWPFFLMRMAIANGR